MKWTKRFGKFFYPIVMLSCLFSVQILLPLELWVADILTNFFFHYFLLQGCGLVLAILDKRLFLIIFLIPFIFIQSARALAYQVERPRSSSGGVTEVNFLIANLNGDEKTTERTVDYALRNRPDIVVLIEIAPGNYEATKKMSAYPYSKFVVKENYFGIGVYSSLPLENARITNFGKGTPPVVLSTVIIGKKKFTLLAIHPMPPFTADMFDIRNRELLAIASWAPPEDIPYVIVGDFNTDSGSFYFRELVAKRGLADTRFGFGRSTTWPAGFGFLKIALDHCLVSRDIISLDRSIGLHLGSDHLPLQVRLGFPK